MGCCLSSNKASTSSLDFAQPPKKLSESFRVEEEKVKEVLSETPKWKPKTTNKSELPQKPHQNIKTFHKVNEKKALLINKSNDNSKICSLRKTMATTNTEETGKRVNGSPVKLHKNCSFSGDTSYRREGKVQCSRNLGSVRLVQCRDQVGEKMVTGGMRRRCDPIPRDNSFRRSRSPATRVDTVFGRNPSARRTNRSPAVERTRTRTAMPEKVRRETEIPVMNGKRVSGIDLLENPLVSLECFIFI